MASAKVERQEASAVAPGTAFGLYPASDFRLTDGHCSDCPTVRQALWYFEREAIAVPRPGLPVSSFAPGLRAFDDLREWLSARDPDSAAEHPPLVWVAAPHLLHGAELSRDASKVAWSGRDLALSLVPRIPLNRSYFDRSSAEFFGARRVRIRGTLEGGALVARTLWPEDFRLGRDLHPAPGVPAAVTVEALRALVRAEARGGAQSPYATVALWRRESAASAVAPGRAVLGFILNGAQGDDDEAHGGHFALVTGRTREDGAIGDWLVNNFYSLDTESEKGILGAPVPLDNYLADLNSGQNWYRPSYLIAAVLSTERAAALVQAALNRVYSQFWRHQLIYRHATMNCAGISVDVLRTLGWELPARAPAGRLLAALGLPYLAVKERSLAKAKTAFDYLTEDQTRLMPAATFEEAGASLAALVGGGRGARRHAGPLARMLADDTEAIAFVRFPQFPSSRAVGDAPAVTPWEFDARLPKDRSKLVIVRVPAAVRWPFPDALRDPDLIAPEPSRSDYAAAAWGIVLLAALGLMVHLVVSRWL